MGYDLFRGAQLNFGFRVAEAVATTTVITAASATLAQSGLSDVTLTFPELEVAIFSTGSAGVSATASDLTTERRSFFGAGPRAGLEGSVPLIGPWSFDYSGNAALLFGNTKISSGSNSSSTNTFSQTIFTAVNGVTALDQTFRGSFSQTGILNGQQTWSAPIVVYNFDIQAGIAFWFTPNIKLAVSYRLDAFLDVLRAFPDDGVTRTDTGPGRSIDRFYHGPKLTLTGRLDPF
jgi:hypothetical protein